MWDCFPHTVVHVIVFCAAMHGAGMNGNASHLVCVTMHCAIVCGVLHLCNAIVWTNSDSVSKSSSSYDNTMIRTDVTLNQS